MPKTIVTYDGVSLPQERQWVHFAGSDLLKPGYPLCYDFSAGTAADVEADRLYEVVKPNTADNMRFAGIVAPGRGDIQGPCDLQIIPPGNPALVWTDLSCTSDTTFLTFAVGAYKMSTFGLPGRGSAVALQTVDRSGTNGLVLAYLQDGPESGGVEEVTPVDDAAITFMAGGVTRIQAATLGTGDSTVTVADGLFNGMKKGIICTGTVGTNDVDVTVTHHETSDPEHLFFDAANEVAIMEWLNHKWRNLLLTAATA